MILKNEKIDISVVIPIWNEEKENIREIYCGLSTILKEAGWTYQIIFVDDGSRDNIFQILMNLSQEDKNITVIKFTKNFGQTAAFLAGFEYAKGDIVVTMDADLQYLPDEMPKFMEKINEGADFVSGYRIYRRDPFFRRITSSVINRIIGYRTGVKLRDWGCSFNAVKKELSSQLKMFGINARFIKAILAKRAKVVAEVGVKHYPRRHGKSKYNFFRLSKLGLDYILFYSLKPLKKNKPVFITKEVIG